MRTQVVSAALAFSAALAADSDLHGDSVADFEGGGRRLVRSEGSDNSAGFVAEDERFSDFENTVGAVVVVVRWDQLDS